MLTEESTTKYIIIQLPDPENGLGIKLSTNVMELPILIQSLRTTLKIRFQSGVSNCT